MLVPTIPENILGSLHEQYNKRNANADGTSNHNLTPPVIIIIVLLCAGFSVLMGYSITRFFINSNADENSGWATPQFEQAHYMQEVRERAREELWKSITNTRQPGNVRISTSSAGTGIETESREPAVKL